MHNFDRAKAAAQLSRTETILSSHNISTTMPEGNFMMSTLGVELYDVICQINEHAIDFKSGAELKALKEEDKSKQYFVCDVILSLFVDGEPVDIISQQALYKDNICIPKAEEVAGIVFDHIRLGKQTREIKMKNRDLEVRVGVKLLEVA